MSAEALLWRGGRDFEIVTVPLPDVGPGETLVRLTAATVCGSDRHTVSGRRPSPCPSVLGHEGVGEVVASEGGRTVAGDLLRPGHRVVFGVTRSCGHCAACRRGLSAKCATVTKVGHESFAGDWPLSGTYASHILLREGQAVSTVPAAIEDGAASTAGCAVATVMAVLERAGELTGRRVLVNGLGMLGLVAVAAARSRGAEVLAVDPAAGRRRLAESFAPVGGSEGASGAGGARPLATSAVVDDGVDVALEFSGTTAGVRACLDALEVGGSLVLAGSVAPAGTVEVDPEWVVRGWRTITGVHNYEPRHLQEAVAMLSRSGDTLPWDEALDGPVGALDLAAELTRRDVGRPRTVVRW
ncbi:zinc-binding dehydrogenase [Janibacter corallicola]|uniref:zinc-binding dehydrogenase n=1 Tax=Janibacter corallicola TaxID=415212 RepID=UPI00082C2A81|nr:zinc-binding dehydrogenase [Janibacter corallicola]